MIPQEYHGRFADRCVCRYIIKRGRYGYINSGMNEIFESFASWFSEETWRRLLQSIVDSCVEDDIDSLIHVGDSISLISLHYMLTHFPEEIDKAYYMLCDAHDCMITANGRFCRNEYSMCVDSSIASISDFVNYQLNNYDRMD